MPRKRKQVCGLLPAGKYYIGDPCYAIRDREAWGEFLQAYYKASEDDKYPAVFTWRGRACFLSPTNCGDGCYHDQYDNEFRVDAGLIGAVPIELIVGWQSGYAFPQPFEVGADTGRWNKSGKTIYIGPHRIRT